jgi:hypothetical protein
MGRWDDDKGGLAHREGIRQEHRRGEVGTARSVTDLCSALPRIGRRVGADPISFGSRFGYTRIFSSDGDSARPGAVSEGR